MYIQTSLPNFTPGRNYAVLELELDPLDAVTYIVKNDLGVITNVPKTSIDGRLYYMSDAALSKEP